MEISLTKLPWYGQVGAFVLLAGAGVWSYYYYYEKPARAEMVSRQSQLKTIKADIARGKATAQKLDEFRADVADLEARLSNLKAVLPEEEDAAELLRSMQNVAMQSNLTIKVFKPAVPITQELHAEWPITLELDGTYHNLATFFDRIGKFTRIINISSLTIDSQKATSQATISAKCVATTYVLLDPAVAASAKPKPKAKPAAPPAKKAA